MHRCRTLMLVGDDSPHLDDVVEMNGRMLPGETDFVKVCQRLPPRPALFHPPIAAECVM